MSKMVIKLSRKKKLFSINLIMFPFYSKRRSRHSWHLMYHGDHQTDGLTDWKAIYPFRRILVPWRYLFIISLSKWLCYCITFVAKCPLYWTDSIKFALYTISYLYLCIVWNSLYIIVYTNCAVYIALHIA